MPYGSLQLMWLIPLAPLAVALCLWPVAALLPRGFVVGAALVGWLVSLGACLFSLDVQLEQGGWARFSTEGFTGQLLIAESPFGEAALLGHPLSLLLATAVLLGGGLCLLDGARAFGGGPRRERAPVSGGVLLSCLALLGLSALVALARTLTLTVGAAALASVVGSVALFATRPDRDAIDAAGPVFVWHRVGDAAFALALVILSGTFGELDPIAIGWRLVDLGAWVRAEAGPLAGFPAQQIVDGVALLLLIGVASRLPLLPMPLAARNATGAPASTLALVHAVCGYGLGLLLLFKVAPLLARATDVLPAVAIVAAASALVSALSAIATRDLLRIDLTLLHAYAAFAVAAFALGQPSAAALVAVHLALLAPALGVTTGAAIEALQGSADAFEMGGLWRALPRTDLSRALAVLSLASPGLAAFLAVERAAFEAFAGPFGGTACLVLLLSLPFALSLAAFRALHLVFSGDAPRGPRPARLVELPAWRWLGPVLVAFFALAAGFVFAAPRELLGGLNPGHQEVFLRFLEPSLRLSFPWPLSDDVVIEVGRRAVPPGWRLAGMFATGLSGLLGVFASALLYRKGPTALYRRLASRPGFEAVARAFEARFWLDEAFARAVGATVVPLSQLLRTLVGSVLLGDLLTRTATLVGGAVRGGLGLLHNGDVQRGLALVLFVVALLLALWGCA